MMKNQIVSITYAVLLAVGFLHTAAKAQSNADSPEARIAAIQKRAADEADYLQNIKNSVRAERRTEAWAAKTEAALWKSYESAPNVAPGALKTVDCRTAQCELLIEPVLGESAEDEVKHRVAVDDWAARGQPCGYTLARDGFESGTPGATHIYIRCGK